VCPGLNRREKQQQIRLVRLAKERIFYYLGL
jgi:hypothetical protein